VAYNVGGLCQHVDEVFRGGHSALRKDNGPFREEAKMVLPGSINSHARQIRFGAACC